MDNLNRAGNQTDAQEQTMAKSSVRSRKNTADNFECRVSGNYRIASITAISRSHNGTKVVCESVYPEALDGDARIAADFPQVQSVLRTPSFVVVGF